MIVPMKKVSLIILENKKEETLKKLRKLGLVHIEITEGYGEKINELKEKISLLESSIFVLGKDGKKHKNAECGSTAEALETAARISELVNEKKARQAERFALAAELEKLKNWGELSPADFSYLSQKGVKLSLCEMPVNEYKKLGDSVKTLVCGKTKSTLRLLVIGDIEDEEAAYALKAYLVALPESSTAKMKSRMAELDGQISDIDEEISAMSSSYATMKNAIKAIEKEIEFEVYSTGMANESLSRDSSNGVSVSYFCGYIESEKLEKLREAAKENSWGLIAEEPTEEDNVPTKLKNNRFVSLIYPLTDFLGTVPGYFEYDISAWFLGFILIFFGIIFGDGGYGLFICAVAAVPIIMALIKKKAISPAFLLMGLFGLSTVLWGTLTCTWFGLAPEQLPKWLQGLSVPFISNVYADKLWYPFWTNGEAGLTTAQNLQIFCFSLALVQLTVAHIKGAVRNRKSVKVLGDIGSIFQLIGIYYVVLALVVNPQVFSLGLVLGGVPVGVVAIALVGVGFLMSFIFANYAGSIIKSVMTSVKNIVSVLLGVVNVFSDIVSYIRLWAVGLAGAAISATVTELAGPLLGNFMFMILAIILLIFGHGLNMILNILSVIVHGIRLNTLEFSSHLDMSWSGHKFKPFEE